jgi:hypothetical protein
MGKKLGTSFINRDAVNIPGANHYQLPKSTFDSPAKTMGAKLAVDPITDGPGPGAYQNDKIKNNDLKYS